MTGERIQTILLDLDGTLIDSTALILSSFRHTMRRHLGRQLPDTDWLATMGRPLIVQLRDFARCEAEVEAMMETYSVHNDQYHDELVKPFPGVPAAVGELRAAGFELGVVTSKRRHGTLRGLRTCGLPLEWFGAIVTADDVTRFKPHPEPVRAALERMQQSVPSAAVYVGDSPWDMRAGRAAGTRTAAVLWGPYGRAALEPTAPDHWLTQPSDLSRIAARWRQGKSSAGLPRPAGQRGEGT